MYFNYLKVIYSESEVCFSDFFVNEKGKVLLIDDEVGKGWSTFFKTFFVSSLNSNILFPVRSSFSGTLSPIVLITRFSKMTMISAPAADNRSPNFNCFFILYPPYFSRLRSMASPVKNRNRAVTLHNKLSAQY